MTTTGDWEEAIDLGVALAKFPLQDWLGLKNVMGEEITLDCPRCSKQKLAVNVATRRWRCFSCERYAMTALGKSVAVEGAGGVFSLIMWLTGWSKRETAQFVIASAQKVLPPDWDLPTISDDVADPRAIDDGVRVAAGMPHEAIDLPGILPYMARRGISWADAQAFGLKWVPPGRSWIANRLVFPVWWGTECLYWQARACWDKSEQPPGEKYRKTLNPAQDFCAVHHRFADGHVRCQVCGRPRQYGTADVLLNAVQASTHKRVVICEGPTSAIRVGPDAVATFGKVLHTRQIEVLRRLGVREVVVAYDGPEPGHPTGAYVEAIHAAMRLAPFFDTRIVFLPHGDPGDWPRADLRRFIDAAQPLDLDKL